MYLTNDALHWYGQEVSAFCINDWNEVKAKFLARFATAIVPPALAAEQRRMTKHDSVNSYAEDKMRLLRLSESTLNSSLALLTAGTFPSYRQTLYSANPQSNRNNNRKLSSKLALSTIWKQRKRPFARFSEEK